MGVVIATQENQRLTGIIYGRNRPFQIATIDTFECGYMPKILAFRSSPVTLKFFSS